MLLHSRFRTDCRDRVSGHSLAVLHIEAIYQSLVCTHSEVTNATTKNSCERDSQKNSQKNSPKDNKAYRAPDEAPP